jgi:hypothetical protein
MAGSLSFNFKDPSEALVSGELHLKGWILIKKAKRILVIIGLLGLWTFLFQSNDWLEAKEADYPTKPITLYVAYGVGGTTDMTFRAFGDAASKHLGQPFVYINRAGAGGTLAAMSVMTAKPDGYTLGTVTASNLFFAPFSEESPYHDLTGFTMVTNIANFSTLHYELMECLRQKILKALWQSKRSIT